jgi:hypothetical protein
MTKPVDLELDLLYIIGARWYGPIDFGYYPKQFTGG